MQQGCVAVTRTTFGTLGNILIILQMHAEMTAGRQTRGPETSVKIPLQFFLFSDAFRIRRTASSHAPSLARIKLFVWYVYLDFIFMDFASVHPPRLRERYILGGDQMQAAVWISWNV